MSYVLGFPRPPANANDRKYHRLKVNLVGTQQPLLIQARTGYFPEAPPSKSEKAKVAARERLDREVNETTIRTDFPIAVGFRTNASSQPGMVTVKAQIHLAVANLHFALRDRLRLKQLTLVASLFDSTGRVVAAEEGTLDLALTDATYSRLSANGVDAILNLDAPPGKYRLRVVAQDSADAKLASAAVDAVLK